MNFKIHGRGAQARLHNPFHSRQFIPDPDHLSDWDEQADLLYPKPETKLVAVRAKSLVNRVDSPDVPMGWSLNPYQGCEHGCVYCYARNSHTYWDGGAGLEFESTILYKPDAPRLLEEFISKPSWKGDPIVMAGNTDIYQPVERKLDLTRQLLQVFQRYLHPVGMITKNSLIERDIEILKDLAEKGLVHVNMTLTTLQVELKRTLEPRTSSARSVLKTIHRLSQNGIPVSVLMAPIIPGLNDHEIFGVAEAAAEAGAVNFGGLVIRLNGQLGELMTAWLDTHYPERKDKVLNGIRQMHGGSVNDSVFGRRMTGEGPVADMIRRQIQIARKRFFSGKVIPEFNQSLFSTKKPGQLGLF